MLQVEMAAAVRTVTGKGAMRRLRSQGLTPAVVYGAGSDALALEMDTKTVTTTLLEIYRRNAVITLNIAEGGAKNVVVKEVQTDPVEDTLIHADFCEIDLEKTAVFSVPLKFKGTAKGVDLGGRFEIYATALLLEGKPLDIPNEVTLDVSGVNIGEYLTFSAVTTPQNVKMVSKADDFCVGVVK
ncbi:MAG: 50S ribosomal protein L25 [Desulfopila sp.]